MELCVQLYRCNITQSTRNRELCVQLYLCTVLHSKAIVNCVSSCTGVLIYTVQAMRNFMYSCTGAVMYFTGNRELCVQLYRRSVIYSLIIIITIDKNAIYKLS
jgi:hypothetical protein